MTTLPVTTTSTMATTHPSISTTTPLPVIGRWESMPAGLVARSGHVSVWTGRELLVWGNPLGPVETQATGDIYDPSRGVWRPMSAAPEARRAPAAVWTGTRMLIWGGDRTMGDSTVPDLANDGFAYDSATDTWSPIPAAPIGGRSSMFNVWTGTELVVWGGMVERDGMQVADDDGAAYDPATNTWRVLAPSPLGGKDPGVGVWTGREMIIGGAGDATDGDLGWASYDPVTDTWVKIPDPPGVRSSLVYVGVWTGTEVLFSPHGVPDQPAPLAAYNPDLGEWRLTALPPVNLSTVPAVWTGTKVVFWGHTVAGMPGVAPMVGVAYDPATDTWDRLAPDSLGTRWVGGLIATGEGVIVWGGHSYKQYGASPIPLHDDGSILVLPPSTTPVATTEPPGSTTTSVATGTGRAETVLDRITKVVLTLDGFDDPGWDLPHGAPYSAVVYSRNGDLEALWAFYDPAPVAPSGFLFGLDQMPDGDVVQTDVGPVTVWDAATIGRVSGGAASLRQLCGAYQIWTDSFASQETAVEDLVAVARAIDCAVVADGP
ncbi:MAG: hypothetical protein GXP34_03110 [Actinobacteria bacterium]|nr:hypothetical protein [Actinomycetota bacterium]